MRAYSFGFRVTVWTVLALFSWSYGPLFQIPTAIAAEKQKTAARGQVSEKSEAWKQKPEERFEGILTDLREKVGKAGEKHAKGEDDTDEREAIRAKRASIDQISEELRAEFSSTEKRLKTAGLPKEILRRHADFVAHFERNAKELRDNLDGIESAKTKAGRKAKIEKARLHLARVKSQRKIIPLDPNNLPHRTIRAKEKAPRLTPDEFRRDFPEQKSQGKKKIADGFDFHSAIRNSQSQITNKPLLLAFNGPDSDMPLQLPLPSGERTEVRGGLNPKSEINDLQSQLAFTDTAPFLLAQAATQPTADDLAEGPEVQFTDAIRAKAQELGCSPIKLYEFTRNSIDFTPSYGSILGADMCLQTRECNAFDASSLLISMLRSCNIPAHYVTGTIEVPIDKIMNWVGNFTDPMAAATLISSGGIPGKLVITGGKPTKMQMEHTWVETFVSYGPYSGRPSKLNATKIWVPLDPSFKQYTYTEGLDLQAAVPFDAQAFANQIQSTATISETAGYVTNVDSNYIQSTMTAYQAQIQNYINQNKPNATADDIIGKKETKKQELGILPVTLPYKTITVGAKYSEVPDNLRHKVTFEIQDSSTAGISLSYTTSIPEIAGKRITLSYAPATASDEQVINNYGGIFNVPAYLVAMKSQIKIEGVRIASGNSIGLGNQQTFNMKFVSPSGAADSVVSNNVTVGAYYGIGINPSRISKDLIDKRRAKLEAVQNTVSDSIIYTDDYIGELIYTTAMAYFFELDALTNVMSKKYKIADLKHVSEAIVSKEVSVATLYGMPTTVSDASMMIDVDRLIHSAVSQSGDQSKEQQFTIAAGQMSSALEHGIFEQMYQAKGVSTIQVLQLANNQGISIYTINQTNVSTVLPILHVSDEVKTDIQNSVNAGKIVVIPQQNITYYGWTGTGYMVLDPVIGSGAYMISTSLAGGGQCLAAGGMPVVMLASAGSSGSSSSGGAHSCTILTPIHWIEVIDFFVPLGAAFAGMNVMLDLYTAWVVAGSVLTFIPFGAAVIFGILAAILFILLFYAIVGYISSFYSHAYLYNQRRRSLLYG